MKLLAVPASPFARLVRLVAAEAGLGDRLEIVAMNPHVRPVELVAMNPLSQVPTLVTEGGAYCDSLLICLYIDSISGISPIVPIAGADAFVALQRHAWADGAMDCLVLCQVHSLMPKENARSAWMQRQIDTSLRVMDRFESIIDEIGDRVKIDTLALASLLTYADFRFPEINWRGSRPRLTNWLTAFETRPSMRSTEFSE